MDYVGVGHHLKKAIDDYDEREQREILDSLSSEEDELRDLIENHRAVTELLGKYGLTNLSDHDAFFDLFYDEDIRFEYLEAFNKLTNSMNLLYPRKEALDFLHDYQALAEINALATSHLNDQRLSMKGIPAKLRTITDAYLKSKGIEQKIEPISILDTNFESEVGKHKTTKTKAAQVEHAIRHHIDINIDEDPELYASLAQALEAILQEFKNNWNKIYTELEKLRNRIKNLPPPPGDLHRKKHMPFFRILGKEIYNKVHIQDNLTREEEDNLVELTKEIFEVVKREIKLTGFWKSIPAINKLKAEIQQVLLSERFNKLPNVVINRNQIISRIIELSRANNDTILYAV